MSQRVSVSEAQDQLLETAFDLYRIRQRLHRQFKGLKAEYESVREYYDADGAEPDAPRPLELQLAVELEDIVDEVESLGDMLRKASRLTNAAIQQTWRVDQKRRRP